MSRLYPCVYCTEDGYCKKYSDEEVTSWCVQSPCKDEKPSNADRIRAMNDEELAEFLEGRLSDCPWCDESAPVKPGTDECELADCTKCALDWLRREATE